MGIAGVAVSLLAAGIALVVLPALLAVLGTRVNALASAFLARRVHREARPAQEGFWYRLARFVMRFPGRTAVAAAAVLIALGLPFLGVKYTAVDARVLPASASAKRVDDALRTEFPPFRDSPIVLTADAGPQRARQLASDAARQRGVAEVRRPRRLADGSYEIDVISSHGPLTPQSRAL